MQAKFGDIQDIPYSEKIQDILQEALNSVDPQKAVENYLLRHKTADFFQNNTHFTGIENKYLIGVGKAVLPMAKGALMFLGNGEIKGTLIAKHKNQDLIQQFPRSILITQGAHPVPDESSVEAARKLIESLSDSKENDLVICLISGGGSALMTYPHSQISLPSIQQLTKELLKSGADINEMNTIRKHVDQVKGGGLLRHIWPSHSITLILSDVIGDSVTMIASGPTAPDPTTYKDALGIIKKYSLLARIDKSIVDHLQNGFEGKVPETVKPGDKILEKNSNVIVGSITHAAEAARRKAKDLGFVANIVTTTMTGEAREKGKEIGEKISKMQTGENDIDRPICLIYGGETTVTIQGNGKGGRNQELALAAAIEIDGLRNCYVITLATDGEDGPTDAAGAVISGNTLIKARKMGLEANEYLEKNDSYHFFEKINALIKTGPTGTNVNDLTLAFLF